MGRVVIDAADKEMIGQIFHRLDAGFPAVSTEVFTKRPSALPGIDMGMRGAEFAQLIVIKFAVSDSAEPLGTHRIAAANQHLIADVVDACHMLASQTAEIMTERTAETGVNVVVLDQMSDIHDAVVFAPVA